MSYGFAGAISTSAIDKWADDAVAGTFSDKEYRSSSKANLYAVGDTVYSFGRHFPVAYALRDAEGRLYFLLNGDSRSNTTNRHQSIVRGRIDSLVGAGKAFARFIVPFSALERANVEPREIELVSYGEDREERYTVTYRPRKYITGSYSSETGRWTRSRSVPDMDQPESSYEATRHILGDVVFKHTRTARMWVEDADGSEVREIANPDRPLDWATMYITQRGRWIERAETSYYLSGIDSTAARGRQGYFLTRLTGPVSTVAEAFESLKPAMVKAVERIGREVKRQGDIFFIPAMVKPVFGRPFLRDATIPDRFNSSTRHVASTAYQADGGAFYVKGRVTHSGGDHGQVLLKEWHRAVQNEQAGSWSTDGRVD